MANDILQQTLNSSFLEIEEIEKEVAAQLDYLGKTVDVGFSQLSQMSRQSLIIVSGIVKASRFVRGLGMAVMAFTAAIGAIERIKAAKAHNKALDELLQIKRKVASEKIASINVLSLRIEHRLSQFEGLIDSEVYFDDYERLDSNSLIQKLFIMDKTLALYRGALYCKLLIDYLKAEYQAWTDGEQCSSMNRPTYYDCNELLAKRMNKMKSLHGSASVNGADVYLVHDSQILSTVLIDYGLRKKLTIKRAPKVKSPFLRKIIKENPSYKSYCKSAWYMNYVVKVLNEKVLFCLIYLAFLTLNYLFFQWVEWYTVIEWILGIIMALVEVIILALCYGSLEEFHESWQKKVYTEELNKQLRMAGYVEIYRPDLKKKSLVWEGVKGAVLGIFG